MQPGWCLICGSADKQEFARQAAPRFVICRHCGHVYQDPIPEAGATLDQNDADVCCNGETALTDLDRERGRRICDGMAPLVESVTRGRRVLSIGCGAASLLAAFKQRGWEVCGRAEAFRGQTFSLILFCHALERLPDPLPKLRAMRRYLDPDGLLFVATPNLANPPAAGPLQPLFSGTHARLYSPGALQTVLARSGLRTRTEWYERADFGMGVLAQLPHGRTQTATEGPLDDAAAISELFLAVQDPKAAGPSGRNLAALLATQPQTMPSLCRKAMKDRLRFAYWGGTVVGIAGIAESGEEVPLVSWEGPGEGSLEAAGRITQGAGTIVLLGLGSGVEARKLAGRLTPDQHLYIWETDPALAKAVLAVADLSELWASGRVTLLLGERPLQAVPRSPVSLYWTHAARHWNHSVYERIAERLTAPAQTAVSAAG